MGARRTRQLLLGGVALGLALGRVTDAFGQRPAELTELPLEALMNLEVTSVSKHAQRLVDSAAAISVLTQDDIRRSGATTIPEALRLVPGLYVARVDSNVWVVNARGFAARFNNKFLVLLDGRSVYTPVFSGVFWDVQDTVLEDIERIEVIRGPGAALWGANAVNGVINIITKSARDTQGGLLSGGAGTEERGFGTVRYGGKAGGVALRAYAKYFNRDDQELKGPGHRDAGDGWEVFRGGVRADADLSERDTLTILADGYTGTVGEPLEVPSLLPPFATTEQLAKPIWGFNLLGRWQRAFSEASSILVQAYYDLSRREDPRATVNLDTVDVEVQYRRPLGTWNDFTAGVGYRYHHFESMPGRTVSFSPQTRDLNLFSAFAHNDTTIIEKTLHLILGTKLEHNTFTGLEWQPNGRLLWTPNPDNTIWGAVSRAVRTPSIVDRQAAAINLTVVPPNPPAVPVPVLVQGSGNPHVQSEKLLAYELGYRTRPLARLSVDIAAFYNVYEDIIAFADPTSPQLAPVPHVLAQNALTNAFDAETYGTEVGSNLDLLKWWRLRASYTYLEVRLHRKPGVVGATPPGFDPQHYGYLRSSMELGPNVEFDLIPRYVGPIPELKVDGYLELDARIAWRPTKALELSLVGRNLVHARHSEFNNAIAGPVPVELQREVYAKLTVKY
ncbi:MAG TPA: TonB-dependent receptor [Methylomirabilota bacterium]|nr:TonB-dependent receptor [Methylomirabilota bacterium]